MSALLEQAKQLPVAERIRLVEDIWDTIAAKPDEMKLTSAQEQELKRRIEYYDKHPEETVPWEAVKARTLERLRG